MSEILEHGDGITFTKSEVYCNNRSENKIGNPSHVVALCLTCDKDRNCISDATKLKMEKHGWCPCCGHPIKQEYFAILTPNK